MKSRYLLLAVGVVSLAAVPVWCQQPASRGAPRDSAGPVLTLDEAIAQALENNPSLKVASLEVLKSENSIAATRTRRFPKTSLSVLGSQLLTRVEFQVEQGQFGTFPGIGPVPAERTFISTPRRPTAYVVGQVAQPLSQLFEINLGIRQYELNRDVNKQKLRRQQQDVIINVKKLYFAALESESALESAEETLAFYRELDRVVGNYVLEKVALKSDSLDVKTRLARLEYDTLSLRNSRDTLKEQLNQLMGRDLRTDFTLRPVAEPSWLETDLTAAQNRALAQRPEVQEARLRVQQAEQERRIKRAEYIPDVSLSFNYISPFGIEFLPKNIASLGLQFTWEPFDWGRRKQEVEEKRRAVEQARSQQQDTEQRALVDVNEKFRKLAESRALLRVTEMARDSEREKVRVMQVRYGERDALLNDVLSAQSSLAVARHNYRKAVLGFWAAKADFERAVGDDR
jgi:outer membrane protein TolC